MPPADTEAAEHVDGERRGWSRGAKVQLLLILFIVASWAAIYGFTIFGDPGSPDGQMEDTAFAAAAEPRCATTLDDIDRLGLPTEVETPLERAEMVDQENDLLRAMVGDLRALDRPAGEEAGWVAEWLDDWDTHIADRQEWADDLRAGEDHPFRETDRQGEQLSKGIDYFAEVNAMPSCATPGDV